MKALEPLLQKDVTRKEFITIAAFGLASLFGLSSIIKLMTGKSGSERLSQYTGGYSSSDYGGKNR